jgi:hypothetical protein
VLFDRIAQAAGDLVDRALEPYVTERLDLAAVTADEMVVMVAVGARRLEPRDSVAGFDSLDQPEICERLEGTVDRGDPDRPPGPPKAVEDLLRAHAAVLAAQEVHNSATGAPAAEACAFQCFERMTSPAHGRSVSSRA